MAGVAANRYARKQMRRNANIAVAVALASAGALTLAASNARGATAAITSNWEVPTITDTNYAIPNAAIFVAPNGNDNNAGSQGAPLATIAKAIKTAGVGATVVLRGGTYREALGSISKSITFQAFPHEQPWIKGSLVATGFATAGPTWTKPWTTTTCNNCYPSGVLDPLYPNAGMGDQVFIDGAPLAEVSNRNAVGLNSFYMDRGAHQLVLGSNPNGHTVEVTTQDKAMQFNSSAGGSALKGIGIAHYAAHYNSDVPAMVVVSAPNMLIDNTTFAWSASRGLSFYSAYPTITNSLFIDNGMNGVHSYQSSHLVFRHNRLAYSNFERFSILPSSTGSVGAAKMTMASYGLYDNNLFEDNYANGLWFDVSSSNNTVVNSTFTRNYGHGLDIELSSNTIAAGNSILLNLRDGLKISGSNNVEAWNNTILANGWAQLGVYEDPRTKPPAAIAALGITWDTANVHIMNNVIVSGPYSQRPVLNSFDLTSPTHATTQTMVVAQDNNMWGRTSLGLKYLGYVQATLVSRGWYTDLASMQSGLHRDTHSTSVDGFSFGAIFANLGSGSVVLANSAPKPAPAALPTNVASAMGISTNPGTIGAVRAPIA